MDIIDKIFEKLQKDQAPHALRAKVLDIPDLASGKVSHSKFSRRSLTTFFKFSVPALVVVLLASSFFYFQYWRVPQVHASFELTAEQTTDAGISPDSAFILKSSASLTSFQIQQIIKFDPKVDFSVENAGDKRYRIVPKGALGENQIYKVTIAEGPADHDYSWAYQIKASFQVISTIPGNHSHDAPLNTGIEMNLNREGVDSPEQSFAISPTVAGSFEQHSTLLLFRPSKPLDSGKVYTVTLKKGLKTKKGDEALANDYVFSFETVVPQNNTGGVVFTSNFVDVVQKRPVFEAYVAEGEKAKGTVYKFDKPEEFISSYRDSDNWQYAWSYYNNALIPKNFDQNSAHKILEYDLTFQKGGNQSYTEIPKDMDNGYYLLDVVSGSAHSYVWFQKTPLAHYASFSYGKSLVWMYDFVKKQPLKDVSIQLTDGRILGATNEEGLAQFDTPKTFQESGTKVDSSGYYNATPNISVVKASGYNPYYIIQATGMYNGYNGIQEGSRYWDHLSTDRPLYQLSDSIQFWGIAKPRDDIKKPEKVKISLYKGYSYYTRFDSSDKTVQPITSVEVPVSDYSTYEGKLDFSGLTADTYSLVVTQGDYEISTKMVTVTSFSKPAYQLSVTTDHKAYNTDQKITFNVTAKFYDGTPIANLALTYNGYWNTNLTGTIVTNSKGEASATVTLPYTQDTPEQPQYWPRSFSINFTPEKAEEGFISKSTYISVIGPKVTLETDNKVGKDGTNNFTVTAHTISTNLFDDTNPDSYGVDYGKAPLAGGQKIQAVVKKTTYTPRQTGEYYDFINKVTLPIYEYDKNESVVDTFSGTTDKNGAWKFDKKYNYEPNVSYSVLYEAADKDGKIARGSSYYLFADNPFFYGGYNYNPNGLQPELSVSNNTKNYETPTVNIGDSVELNLQFNNSDKASSSKPTKIMYYTYQRNIIKADTTNALTYTDTFSQTMSPMVSYRAVVLGPVGFEESNSVDINQDTKSSELKIEVKTDKDQYRPGDTVNATVKVTDSKGNPSSGTTYMSVVDQAVFDAIDYVEPVNTLGDLYKNVIQNPAVSMTQYAKAGSDGGGGGGGPSLPRSKFQDTVVAKSMELNGNGEAKISFVLPQNLTSWRITTQAFDPKSIRAGDNVINISTGLPLFADLSLSTVYIKGDQPQIRVRVFGKQYDAGKPVHISVSSLGLNIKYEQDVKGNTAYIPVTALPVGQYPIEVKAQQGDLTDSLVRTVNVLDSGLTVPKTANVKLTNNLNNVAGNANGLTEIVVTDSGRGSQFGAASWLAGQGGVRFDQRASSFYAQTVLHDTYGLPGEPEKFDPAIFQTKKDNQNNQADQLGLGLFPYGDSDLKASALGASLIPDSLPKQNMIDYFNLSLRDVKADTHRISQALFGLAAYNQPVLTKLQLVKDDPAFDIEDKLFIANALAMFGDKETARKLYNDNIKPKLVSDSGQLYLADPDETRQSKLTALAGMLAAQLNLADDRDKLVLYLNGHEPKKDTATLEEAFIVKASLAQASKDSASFDYKTNKRNGSFELKNGNRFNLQLLSDELKSLQFSNVKGDMELLTWYNGSADNNTKPNLDIPLKRDYSVNGKGSTSFKDGDLVKVTIVAQPKAGAGVNAAYQITDILPAGLIPITPTYFSGVVDGGPSLDPCNPIFNYPDIIDGNKIKFTVQRFVSHGNCGNTTSMRVIYYARVTGFGSYRADPTILTSLENPSQFNLGPTQTITINQ